MARACRPPRGSLTSNLELNSRDDVHLRQGSQRKSFCRIEKTVCRINDHRAAKDGSAEPARAPKL